MPVSIPPWMKPALPIPPEERDRLAKVASNWMKLNPARRTLSEVDCLRILVIELEGKKRPEIIGRVRIWFCKLREQRELNELWASHPGAGVGHQGRTNARKGR